MNEQTVIAYRSVEATYPQSAPFHPHAPYPEYAFAEVGAEKNLAYDSVRACLREAGLDRTRFDTPHWNPLGELIRPGETVLLKPNLVKESHPRDPDGWQYVLTHASVIRAVADYVYQALAGQGRVIIADAPQSDSSFTTIVKQLGLDVIRDFYSAKGLAFELIDLRREEWMNCDGIIVSRRRLPDNAYGNIAFDLGSASEFIDHRGAGQYYGADYDAVEVNYHHTDGRHEYLIAGCAIKCDVVFNLPKLKTHKKAGITVSLKNLVGINADKNWLPHHTEGSPANGGDEHPNPDAKHRIERRLVARLRQLSLSLPGIGTWLHRKARRVGTHIFGDTEKVIRSGNWHGNDTVWRMCLDLNKLILYGNPDGTLRAAGPQNRKRHFALVDGIIAGEGNGPMNPDPVRAGLVVFGLHAASVDAACAVLMGFDPEQLPIVRQAFRCREYPLTEWDWRDVQLISNQANWNGAIAAIPDQATMHFAPHFGWRGRLERTAQAAGPENGQFRNALPETTNSVAKRGL